MDSAQAWLDRSLQVNPLNNRAALLYGEIHLLRGRPELAAYAYSVAVRARPELKLYRRRLVEALVRAGQSEAALHVAHELMMMDGRDPRSIALLCLVHKVRGSVSLAGLVIDRAVARFPRDESLREVFAAIRSGSEEDSLRLWRYATER